MGSRTNSWLSLETGFLVLVVGLAVWMIVESYSFNRSGTTLYPQLTAGLVLGLVGLFVIWQIALPQAIRNRLTSTDEAVSYGSIQSDESADQIDERGVIEMLVVFLGFVVLAYFLGFLVASGLYVYVSQLQFGYGTRRRRLGVTLIVLGIIYLGYLILGIELFAGELYAYLLG